LPEDVEIFDAEDFEDDGDDFTIDDFDEFF
jgi:hypothetical protein